MMLYKVVGIMSLGLGVIMGLSSISLLGRGEKTAFYVVIGWSLFLLLYGGLLYKCNKGAVIITWFLFILYVAFSISAAIDGLSEPYFFVTGAVISLALIVLGLIGIKNWKILNWKVK